MTKSMAVATLLVPSAYFPIKMVARPSALKCLITLILMLTAVLRSNSGKVEMHKVVSIFVSLRAVALSGIVWGRRVLDIPALGMEMLESMAHVSLCSS
jgi:uncharacterized membrane protein YjjB (DUF3815 family)